MSEIPIYNFDFSFNNGTGGEADSNAVEFGHINYSDDICIGNKKLSYLFSATDRDIWNNNKVEILGRDELIDELIDEEEIDKLHQERKVKMDLLVKKDRKYLSHAIFFKNDMGVYMEIPGKPDIYIDVTQEIIDLKNQVSILSQMVNEMYYGPEGISEYKCKKNFTKKMEEYIPK